MEPFAKYQGLGNDFVVLDRRSGPGPVTPEQAVALCDRRRGIGADGVLSVLPSSRAVARMHVANADGSTAEMCGNGLRCVARFLADRGLAGDHFAVETDAGVRLCWVRRGCGEPVEVAVQMGRPELEASRVPMAASGRFVSRPIDLDGETLVGTAVSMGNPHLVLFDADRARAAEIGPRLERHPLFPARTNVELAAVVGEEIEVVVWERGCGLTRACGTGACAAAVAAVVEGRLPAGPERRVRLEGGLLHVKVEPDLSGVTMRGPAVHVFSGEVDLERLVASARG